VLSCIRAGSYLQRRKRTCINALAIL
jgi:hypothetical protein